MLPVYYRAFATHPAQIVEIHKVFLAKTGQRKDVIPHLSIQPWMVALYTNGRRAKDDTASIAEFDRTTVLS